MEEVLKQTGRILLKLQDKVSHEAQDVGIEIGRSGDLGTAGKMGVHVLRKLGEIRDELGEILTEKLSDREPK